MRTADKTFVGRQSVRFVVENSVIAEVLKEAWKLLPLSNEQLDVVDIAFSRDY